MTGGLVAVKREVTHTQATNFMERAVTGLMISLFCIHFHTEKDMLDRSR